MNRRQGGHVSKTDVHRRATTAGFVLAGLLIAVVAPAADAAPRSPEACPPESVTDAWDQSVGVTITADTGFGAGAGLNMFGADVSTAEKGTAFFRDDQGDDFVHSVDWTTTTPVNVRSLVLRAAHDHDAPRRSFKSFVLKGEAPDGSLEVLYTYTPPIPYGFGENGNVLILCDDISSELVTSHFVAEFVQNGSSSFPGPRIMELDGYTSALAQVGATPSPEATAPPVTLAPTAAATVAPVATPAATPTPATPTADGGGTTVLVGIGLLALLVIVGFWFLVGRRRRSEDRPT